MEHVLIKIFNTFPKDVVSNRICWYIEQYKTNCVGIDY